MILKKNNDSNAIHCAGKLLIISFVIDGEIYENINWEKNIDVKIYFWSLSMLKI